MPNTLFHLLELHLPIFIPLTSHLSHIQIHKNEMTYASAHDEEVEHFVGAEELMLRIEEWQLQGIDDTACGIDDATGQQPEECRRGQGL